MGVEGIFHPLKGLEIRESEEHTVSSVPAGGEKVETISFGDGYIMLGMPKVWTETADASVELLYGGLNEFTVKVSNSGGSDKDVVVKYDVALYRGA